MTITNVSLSHISHMPKYTPEETILYYARVSNSSYLKASSRIRVLSTDSPALAASNRPSNLLKYLITHEHWSPFEMVSMCLEIKTTRDISRQILRHRSFSFQEFSQRYANPFQEGLNWTPREARLQDVTNRQSSLVSEDETLNTEWKNKQAELMKVLSDTYSWAIDNRIAREQARSVLPEGLIETRLFMHGTIRSWIHYTELRTGIETQKEHRLIALACQDILYRELPTLNQINKN